jgi:hypothetical protein
LVTLTAMNTRLSSVMVGVTFSSSSTSLNCTCGKAAAPTPPDMVT